MRYGVFGKMRKAFAIIISIALVVCAVPVMQASAEETATDTKVIKEVNFGVINEGLAPGINKDKITLSISSSYTKKTNMAYSKVEAEPSANATSWILAEEASEESMEASVNGGKIILAEGYDKDENYYLSHIIKAEHRKASDVLGNTAEVSALISTEDGEILYYGKIDSATSSGDTSSYFILPRGLEEGKYNLYIFAESSDASLPKKVYTSRLGEPIGIEVVSSLGLYIEGAEEPEPGNKPDTEAVLKVKNGNNIIQETDIGLVWRDEYGIDVNDEFGYNKNYTVNTYLEEYITGYILGEDIAEINNESAKFYTGYGSSCTSYNISKTYKTRQLDDINISGSIGSGDNNNITLKAYKGVIPPSPPAIPDTEYTYEWWNSKLNTSGPSYTGQTHVLTDDDFDVDMELRLNTSQQDNVASKIIKIRGGLIETGVIEGVSKTDESIKGKGDGSLEGLTSGMQYSLDGGNTYNPYTTDRIENIPAGTICRVKIEKDNLIPAGVTGIYAEYRIGEGGTLSVNFDSNGGSSVNAIEDIAYNSVITEPSVPVKDGYKFEGWYKSAEFKDKWDFSTDKVTQNINLFAKWSKNQEENPGGATAEPEGTMEPGDTAKPEETTEPTKKPSGNNSVLPPYVPQVPAAPESPLPTVPAQTNGPENTAAPENKPSQNPETSTTTVPADPEIHPSQAPSDVNTGEDDKPDNTGLPVNDIKEVTVPGNIKLKVQDTGNGNLVISSADISNNKNIVIPDTVSINGKEYKVTKIAENAFAGSDIESVQLGSNITEIGDGAFKGCKKLKSVKCSSGMTSIGNEAFKNCKNLEEVDLGNSIINLGDRVFKGCKKLKNVIIPAGLETIGQGAFRDCESLKKMKLPDSVMKIDKKAFKNCKSMKTFTLGTEKKKNARNNNKKLALRFGAVAKVSIGASALENCIDLRSVVINSQVTKIGNSTFRYCTQLRKMLVKSLKLQKVGNKALQGVHNCKITVPPVKIKPYTTLFKNKGQGKKVVVAKS
ncbi:MAG: leucine-rich repeat protein [Lachnospiraceae bacterium]|nr:leucine-rich repeat protein [Lachnospiraceae bacterium]